MSAQNRAERFAQAYTVWQSAYQAVQSNDDRAWDDMQKELDAAEANALLAMLVTPSATADQRRKKLGIFFRRDIANWRGSAILIDAMLAESNDPEIQ